MQYMSLLHLAPFMKLFGKAVIYDLSAAVLVVTAVLLHSPACCDSCKAKEILKQC